MTEGLYCPLVNWDLGGSGFRCPCFIHLSCHIANKMWMICNLFSTLYKTSGKQTHKINKETNKRYCYCLQLTPPKPAVIPFNHFLVRTPIALVSASAISCWRHPQVKACSCTTYIYIYIYNMTAFLSWFCLCHSTNWVCG